MSKDVHIFEEMGGMAKIKEIQKIFYDKIYEDPWMKHYFATMPQEQIESQQADFMAQVLGGPKMYCGRFPVQAHEHIYVTEELFEYRQKILKESLEEAGLSPEHVEICIKMDEAFKKGIVKDSLQDCKKRFATDTILDFENPLKKKVA